MIRNVVLFLCVVSGFLIGYGFTSLIYLNYFSANVEKIPFTDWKVFYDRLKDKDNWEVVFEIVVVADDLESTFDILLVDGNEKHIIEDKNSIMSYCNKTKRSSSLYLTYNLEKTLKKQPSNNARIIVTGTHNPVLKEVQFRYYNLTTGEAEEVVGKIQ